MAKGNIMRLIKQNYRGADYKRNKGIAILWAAFSLLVLILFMGLAVDGGVLFFSAHQLQNAADAASLAGARIVRINQNGARVQAQRFGELNYCLGDSVALDLNGSNAPDGDIIVGRFYYDGRGWNGFVPLQDLPEDVNDKPDALMVIAKRTADEHGAIRLFFGPIVNVNTADVSRVAIAQAIGGWGAGIITLDCWASKSLLVGDAATELTLIAGGIQVNSSADDAFSGNWNTIYDPAPEVINVNGGVNKLPDSLYDVVNTGAPRMPDPLCPDSECGVVTGPNCLTVPSFGSPIQSETVTVDPNETKTILPGYYPGGITMTSSDSALLLEPGIYILDGVGLNITGGNIFGDGVMFYITGSGEVNLRGGGLIQLNTNFEIESGPFAGITFYQDRANPNEAFIRGNDNLHIEGVLYFPRNPVTIRGTGGTYGTQLIANTLDVGGNGVMQINYDGRNPFPANKAILVY